MTAYGYDVYKVRYKLGMQDPLMGPEVRYHTVVFVETEANGGGRIFHVIGDIMRAQGMEFESKSARSPDESATFHEKVLLGRTPVEYYPDYFESVLRAQPPPGRQRIFNPKTIV